MELLTQPYLATPLGAAYLGDAMRLLAEVPDDFVTLIVTSPPYALQRPKEYDNVPPEEYVEWFMPFARELHRVVSRDGSVVLNLGGSWSKGRPTRSLYQFELLLECYRLQPDS